MKDRRARKLTRADLVMKAAPFFSDWMSRPLVVGGRDDPAALLNASRLLHKRVLALVFVDRLSLSK